jgi:hypothetical protein
MSLAHARGAQKEQIRRSLFAFEQAGAVPRCKHGTRDELLGAVQIEPPGVLAAAVPARRHRSHRAVAKGGVQVLGDQAEGDEGAGRLEALDARSLRRGPRAEQPEPSRK